MKPDVEQTPHTQPSFPKQQAVQQLSVSPPQPITLKGPTEIAPATLLTKVPEAAKALSISERKLWDLSEPRGPIPVVRIGRAVRYDRRDLRAWIDRQKAGRQ